MSEDEIKKRHEEESKQRRLPPIDPVRMFLRTDEKYEDAINKLHDIEVKFYAHENMVADKFRDQNAVIDKLVERMEKQVSFTGHKNSDDIKALDGKMEKIETQLFNKDTGLITQFKESRDWQSNFNRAVIGVFLVSGVVSGIIWLIKTF